jgi:O-antigen ligase
MLFATLWWKMGWRMILVGFFVCILGATIVTVAERYGETMQSRLSGDDFGSVETRQQLYAEAIDTMMENKWTGYTTVTLSGVYPHNVELEAGMSLGIPGILVLSGLLLLVLWRACKMGMMQSDAGIIGLLAIQQLIGAQFSGAIWGDERLWVTAMIVLGTRPLVRRSRAIATAQTVSYRGAIRNFQPFVPRSHVTRQ